MTTGINETIRNSRLNQIRDSIDAGAGVGTIEIYSGTQPHTGGDASPAAWAASTAYAVGDTVQPTTANGYYYRATVAGTTGTTEPTWPTSADTVSDGGVTWEYVGSVAVLLATGTFSDPSAPNAATGTLTFNTITGSDAVADGTASWCRIKDSAGTFVMDMDVGVSGSGAPVFINTTTIVSGTPVEFIGAAITDGNA